MGDERELLRRTAELAGDFLDSLDERPVFPQSSLDEIAAALGGPLPSSPTDPLEVVELMAREIERGVVATAGPRYFGYVIGGALPATVGADWLTTVWDQCAGLGALGPSASVVEVIVGDWLKDLFGLPADASFAVTTGCQMAHVTALAAARHDVLAARDWDVREQRARRFASDHRRGRTAPPRHRRPRAAAPRDRRCAARSSSRRTRPGACSPMRCGAPWRRCDGPTIVCAQAGEVNTGSFDPLPEIVETVRATDAWLHVDGAFGLWAAASPQRRHLVDGVGGADSWATDGHKWLNVPYDCGLVFCAEPSAHRASMTMQASYFEGQGKWVRDAADWTPESSRRARAFTVYAALRSLGRDGVADLVERCCRLAEQFAEGVSRLPGCELLNDVVLNQVLFRFEDDETTGGVLARVQESGEAWMGGTVWEGRAAIRISVSGWRTTEADIERTVAAFEAALVTV